MHEFKRRATLRSSSVRVKEMQTEAKASLIGGLATLTTHLGSLSVDQDPDDLCKALRSAFTERDLYKMYLSFLAEDGPRVQTLLEVFDKALTTPQDDIRIFKKFRQLCGRAGTLPTSHLIPEALIKTTEHPIASGGFGDVWEGIYNDQRVAIKALRLYKDSDVQKVKKMFCKEVAMWKRIPHPNIVPFLGVSKAPAPISMVSEWMPNGNVREYIAKNPEMSRLQLLLDISRGLSFLHSLEIVHGDLKGDNILVDKLGCARLGDFGLTSISSLNCTETSAPSGGKGTPRWMAPELLSVEQNENKSRSPTSQSDVFALGMVAIEVFTGNVPFSENKVFVVTKKIADGERPPQPPKTTRLGLSDELWASIGSLWAHEADHRPPVSTFVDLLERVNPDIDSLEELTSFDPDSEEHLTKLQSIIRHRDNTLFGMRESESLVLIKVFDRVLNSSLDDGGIRSRCLRGLQKVSARCGLLPETYFIARDRLTELDTAFSTTGRVSEVRKWSMDGRLVAVKTINPDVIGDFNTFKQKLYAGAVMWKRIRHRNVATLLGFGSDTPLVSLVYPWVSNGTLSEYLHRNPKADRLGLLLDVADGLNYLHHYSLVHGNLTGHNVLVDADGVACISDCGLELVLREETPSKPIPANLRWMAPEVISADKRKKQPTVEDGKRADIYSLAMVMFEVLTGITPFQDATDGEIASGVITGLRPEWPSDDPFEELTDALWREVQACWSYDPEERPTASAVLQTLQAVSQDVNRERPQGPQEPQGSSEQPDDDEAWDRMEDTVRLVSEHSKEYKEHSSLSSSVSHSIGRIFHLPHHGEGSKRDPSKSHRARAKKHMRHLLHLSDPGSTTVAGGEERKSETEIVEKREESVQVSEGSVSYLTSKPIPNGKKLRKVVITVVSKDQGWSSYQQDHETYRNSWTWFELSVGSPSGERWRGEVVRNLHAHADFKEHTIEIFDNKLYERAESGDVLTVWAHAKFSGWVNKVKKVTIQYVVE